ncbi:hypothetical protein A3860_35565 [Niastella vici]|uniref:LamG-like jellyroll fold domain-containing protein n=1 Tax=Niastella vici TaxID=1703345 RepID=A0A1V9FNP2_9BACT|nr:LamG domain-containing protein [Niastella vici]OQP59963.1 hypothetical protein A3860_35565 [Niastella vici]
MKKLVLSAGALLLLMAFKKNSIIHKPAPVTEPTCASDLKRGLLAYYPFNGNYKDASGNGLHAFSRNGAHLAADCHGEANKAAEFDGTDDYLIVPGNKKLNADSLSISFLVMVNNADRRNVTISRINYETGESLIFGIHESQPDDNAWNYGVTSNADGCSTLYGYDPSMACYSKQGIQPGRWYNIIATFGKGLQKLYVDGVLQSTKKRTFQTAKKCSGGDLLIGGWWKADIVSIDGKLDEVRLYNRVLNECEIAKLAATVSQEADQRPRRIHKR